MNIIVKVIILLIIFLCIYLIPKFITMKQNRNHTHDEYSYFIPTME